MKIDKVKCGIERALIAIQFQVSITSQETSVKSVVSCLEYVWCIYTKTWVNRVFTNSTICDLKMVYTKTWANMYFVSDIVFEKKNWKFVQLIYPFIC